MNRRARVLWLIKGLGLGGAERLLTSSLPYMDHQTFAYSVAYLVPWKDTLVPQVRQAGVPVACLGGGRPCDPRPLLRLLRLLRAGRFDVLHAHLPYAGVLGRVAGRLAGTPARVYTEHNVLERYHPLTAWGNRATYRWGHAVIAVSREVERSIHARIGPQASPPVVTILNGVDPARLAAEAAGAAAVRSELGVPPDHALVLHVGTFTPKKRHLDLLAAAARVLARRPATAFVLVGGGPLRGEVEAQARHLGIAGHVRFAGLRADVPRLMAAADVFVLPSQFEGLPLALLEAMALARPVVATAVGGVPEAVHNGVEGLLVPPLAPEALAEGLLRLLDDPALALRMGHAGQRRVMERFHIRGTVQQTEALYLETLAGQGRKVPAGPDGPRHTTDVVV